MKRYNPMRADDRPIEEKALGLLYAMTKEQASNLHAKLSDLAKGDTQGAQRATLFVGNRKG